MSLPELLGYVKFQSPRGDFGFLKSTGVPIPSRNGASESFNPLAGILVF